MRTVAAAVTAALVAVTGLTGCASAATADMGVGDCLTMGGSAERPEATPAECGSAESNFKVVATVDDSEQCPADVDSYYSMSTPFGDGGQTVCMDIDWVVGDCMSIDPENSRDPVRVDCADDAMPHRQRATQILDDVASVDQCGTGLGYAYDTREFTVCVEDVA